MQPATRLLLVGQIPPPIGGVTIYIQRLQQSLDAHAIPYGFSHLRKDPKLKLIKDLWQHSHIHLHVSNIYVVIAYLLAAKLLGKYSIFTLHANAGRYAAFRSWAERWAFRLANQPIVINEASEKLTKHLHPKLKRISAFIPPAKPAPLPAEIQKSIQQAKKKYATLFCTNASVLDYDKNRRDIYGVFYLLALFKQFPEMGLVVSDPSAAYAAFWKQQGIALPPNVILLSGLHDFVAVIQACQVFVRATSTDGDSLSVKEALFLEKTVMASNCVDRPPNCLLFDWEDPHSLPQLIRLYQNTTSLNTTSLNTGQLTTIENGFDALKTLYDALGIRSILA